MTEPVCLRTGTAAVVVPQGVIVVATAVQWTSTPWGLITVVQLGVIVATIVQTITLLGVIVVAGGIQWTSTPWGLITTVVQLGLTLVGGKAGGGQRVKLHQVQTGLRRQRGHQECRETLHIFEAREGESEPTH